MLDGAIQNEGPAPRSHFEREVQEYLDSNTPMAVDAAHTRL